MNQSNQENNLMDLIDQQNLKVDVSQFQDQPSTTSNTKSTPSSSNPIDLFDDPLSRSMGPSSTMNSSTNAFSPTNNASRLDQSSLLTQSVNLGSPTSSMTQSQQTAPLARSVKRDKNLKGIYGFFGSQELPPNPKHATIQDIPSGFEAIPFIFENKCYGSGAELMNSYMKAANSPEEVMYFRIIKITCMMKIHLWEKVLQEFTKIGNIEKIINDGDTSVYLPFTLRLLHALLPFISTLNFTKSSSSHAPKSDDKTIEGLFNLYNFTESKIKEFKYNSEEKLPGEALDMFTVCDVDIREDRWISRLFRVTVLIIEVLQSRNHYRGCLEFIEKALQKFSGNPLLLSYLARAKLFRGEQIEAKKLFQQVEDNLPKDSFIEFISFNNFLQLTYDLRFQDARALIIELAQKYPHCSTLAYNNLAYLYIAEGQVKDAIELLEDIIRTEPWNINETIASNLLNLYELYYHDNRERRRVLEEIIDRYATEFNKAAILHQLKIDSKGHH